jgi:hypothetical protein
VRHNPFHSYLRENGWEGQCEPEPNWDSVRFERWLSLRVEWERAQRVRENLLAARKS